MVLADVQTVTGKKTFDTTKLAMTGSSTGVNTIASAIADGTDYTNTLPAKTGTFAMKDDVTYIGTTSVALNRTTAALTLAGITLTTPDIGTPSAGTLTNCDGTAASLNIGGNAATATKLAATKTIGGVAFDGSANITVASATGGFTVTGAITLTEAMSVASDKKLNLEGSGGDTYFIYNSSASKVELYVNNTKKAEWG